MAVKMAPSFKQSRGNEAYVEAARQQALADALAARGQASRGPTPRTATAAGLNGLNDIVAALTSQYASKQAGEMQKAADRDTSTQNRQLIQAMMQKPGVQIEGTDITTPGKLDPAANDLAAALAGQDPRAVQGMLASQQMARAMPAKPEAFTLSPGETRYDGGKAIATQAAAPLKEPDAVRTLRALADDPELAAADAARRRAAAPNQTVSVNTEKNLYGTMADAQGKANVELYGQAQRAPELLQRAQRVKAALGPNSQAITGAGADQLLMLSKVAAQVGFNTGDAAADTEGLARDLAASTLDQIKSSGLGAGSGFSNADRDFLEKVVGGKITLEAATLRRLADLNEKGAINTIQRWNAVASRLQPDQLETLGMAPIEMPEGTPAPTAQPRLQKNPDGSFTYSP